LSDQDGKMPNAAIAGAEMNEPRILGLSQGHPRFADDAQTARRCVLIGKDIGGVERKKPILCNETRRHGRRDGGDRCGRQQARQLHDLHRRIRGLIALGRDNPQADDRSAGIGELVQERRLGPGRQREHDRASRRARRGRQPERRCAPTRERKHELAAAKLCELREALRRHVLGRLRSEAVLRAGDKDDTAAS
jgi:hypothetical protein